MKQPVLLVVVSAASLASGLAFAQMQNQPYSQTQPDATKPAMETTAPAAGSDFTLVKFDSNGDGFVDKQEAKASSTLTDIFDKADVNKDGKLDTAELSAASRLAKSK